MVLNLLHTTNSVLSGVPYSPRICTPVSHGNSQFLTIDRFKRFPGLVSAFSKTIKLGSATGVIISEKGHVLTSAHVADSIFHLSEGFSKDACRYELPGVISGYRFKAVEIILPKQHKIISRNAKLAYIGDYYSASNTVDLVPLLKYSPDLAVLQIPELEGVEAIKLSEQIPNIGDCVYLIGNPIGLGQQLVSQGKILDFKESFFHNFDGFHIVSDCPEKSGNSGGPLVDKYGGLIGILCWGGGVSIRSNKSGVISTESRGYAIPITSDSCVYNETAYL